MIPGKAQNQSTRRPVTRREPLGSCPNMQLCRFGSCNILGILQYNKKISTRFFGIFALLLPAALAGCATADKNVRLAYLPIVNAVGENGEPYGTDVEWVLGEIRGSDGNQRARLLPYWEPKYLVADAFVQEQNAAGYRVMLVPSFPAATGTGLIFSGHYSQTGAVGGSDENAGQESTAGKGGCLEIWRQGKTARL